MRNDRALRRRLVEAGISRKYLKRLSGELDDHYADLAREARAAEKPVAEALREAHDRLGSDEVIAAAFLARPELRSWRHNHPAAAYCADLLEQGCARLLLPIRALRPALPGVARYGLATAASVILAVGILFAAQWLIMLEAESLPRTRTARTTYLPIDRLIREDTATRSALLDAIEAAKTRTAAPPAAPVSSRHDIGPVTADRVENRATLTDAATPNLPAEAFRDYLPILKVAPVYPAGALSRKIEGYVILEFTVARSGAVKNVVVVESSNPVFEKSATEAAYKFKYSPRIVDGKTVEVEGVRNKITFDLSA